VTAATHFDAGRNMIAMITGAKRYILSPPRECPKLGIVTVRGNASFRHSMLNFGHLTEMDNPGMPVEEREWMKASGDAMSLETVLKGKIIPPRARYFAISKTLMYSFSGFSWRGVIYSQPLVPLHYKFTKKRPM
jgi:hypothetical protein